MKVFFLLAAVFCTTASATSHLRSEQLVLDTSDLTASPCGSTLESVVSLFKKANTAQTKTYKGKPLQEALAQFATESKEAKICVVSKMKWGKSKYHKGGEYSKVRNLVDELKECCEKAAKSLPLPPQKPPASLPKAKASQPESREPEAVKCDSHMAAYCKTIKYNDDKCRKFQSSCKKKKEKKNGEPEAVKCDSKAAAYCKTIKYNDDSCRKFQSSCGAPNDNDEEQTQTQTATPCGSTLESVVSLFKKANTAQTKSYKGKPLQEALAQFATESKEAKICVVSKMKWGKSKYHKGGEYSKVRNLVDELKECCEKAAKSQEEQSPASDTGDSADKSYEQEPASKPNALKKLRAAGNAVKGAVRIKNQYQLAEEKKVKAEIEAAKEKKESEKTADGQKVPVECQDQRKYLPDHASCKITQVPADWVSCPSRTREGQCSWFCKHTGKTVFDPENPSFVPTEECTATPKLAPAASGYEDGACVKSCAAWDCGRKLPFFVHMQTMTSLTKGVDYDHLDNDEKSAWGCCTAWHGRCATCCDKAKKR